MFSRGPSRNCAHRCILVQPDLSHLKNKFIFEKGENSLKSHNSLDMFQNTSKLGEDVEI